jgi:RNA polymerase sigma-70 factor (ECF subfamily)
MTPKPVPTEEPTDDVLVARILAGAKSDFALLMRRYNQRLYRAVRAVVRQGDEAEDVVQQAWVAAYRALAGFRGDSSLATWLTRIAVNEALGRARARARHGDLQLVTGDDMAATDPSPEDASLSREAARLLEERIDALPEPYRLVLMMRDIEEMTTAETATALGIQDGAVRVRLHRARQLLAAAMAERLEYTLPETFRFDGARCDRIVAGVLAKI